LEVCLKNASKGLFVFAGLLATPLAKEALPNTKTASPHERTDPRLTRLHRFFEERECPINKLAKDFIEAADDQELDWRLLPSIAVVESSGGKYYRNNNIFGWDSCRQRFSSVRAGIRHVADRLANSDTYKDKNIDEILRTYNPEKPDYPRMVKAVMASLGPPNGRTANTVN
jgi:hypothetical protein